MPRWPRSALIISAGALGLNSIAISRIEGASGAGLIALATQFIFLATLVAGAGPADQRRPPGRARAVVASQRDSGALVASVVARAPRRGASGWAPTRCLRDSALSDFSLAMAAALMAALPFALAWWILPAVPLARELFEQYALLTGVGAGVPCC